MRGPNYACFRIMYSDDYEDFMRLFLTGQRTETGYYLNDDEIRSTPFAKATTLRWPGLVSFKSLNNDNLKVKNYPVAFISLPAGKIIAFRNGLDINKYNYAVVDMKNRDYHWRQCISDCLDCVNILGCSFEELPLMIGPDVHRLNVAMIERRLKEV